MAERSPITGGNKKMNEMTLEEEIDLKVNNRNCFLHHNKSFITSIFSF